ncbi:MAG TPA: hypothetical protein EYN91_24985 [Candidatus Melainabacteria bacterium]|jgi:hypothetical protein|nr:hypothetical protein [Candidatus Melainabacteria bacterium]HIN63136.1 hypothetical protein [Candidatus Obscuribacterales bacterium]
MSQSGGVAQAAKKKGQELVKALLDLLILALLLAGAGFGGYFWGLHERLAPIQEVPPGTANALQPSAVAATPAPVKTVTEPTKTNASAAPPAKVSKTKYWITSSGEEYIGYSITAKINGNAVDSFFGPGKNVDITRYVTPGDNSLTFEAKALGEQYNKHDGDASSVLTLQLVKGPHVQEDFKPSDVLVTYKRNAAEKEDFNDSEHFTAK